MDKELEDLFHGAKQEPTRSSRFAPKGSKLKPYLSSASPSLPLPSPNKKSADEIKPEYDQPKLQPNLSSALAPLPLLSLKAESPDEIKPDQTKRQPNLSSADEIWSQYVSDDSMGWSDYVSDDSMGWSDYVPDDSMDWSQNEADDSVDSSQNEADDSVDSSQNEPDDSVDSSQNEPDDYLDWYKYVTDDYLDWLRARSVEIKAVTSASKEARPHFFSLSTKEYLKWFCPATCDRRLSSKLRFLLALPLKIRFESWLRQGPPLKRFRTLMYLAPENSAEDVLRILQELAVLVQGLWVLRTSLLYEEQGGLGPFARNYVLVLFSKDVTIKESQLPNNLQLTPEIKVALHGLAIHRPILKDWILKAPPDLDFIKHNPTVVMDQQKEWERVEVDINNQLRTMKTSMPEVVREAIKKALQKFFESTKTCSIQQIMERLRDIAVSENAHINGSTNVAGNSINEFRDELHKILNGVAVNIHGIYVPKSSPDHPEYDDLRDVVIGLLVAKGPNAKLKKAIICEAASIKLGKEPTQVAYQKVMLELCVCKGNSWSLKPPAQRFY